MADFRFDAEPVRHHAVLKDLVNRAELLVGVYGPTAKPQYVCMVVWVRTPA
jgi:hypothetical protein